MADPPVRVQIEIDVEMMKAKNPSTCLQNQGLLTSWELDWHMQITSCVSRSTLRVTLKSIQVESLLSWNAILSISQAVNPAAVSECVAELACCAFVRLPFYFGPCGQLVMARETLPINPFAEQISRPRYPRSHHDGNHTVPTLYIGLKTCHCRL